MANKIPGLVVIGEDEQEEVRETSPIPGLVVFPGKKKKPSAIKELGRGFVEGLMSNPEAAGTIAKIAGAEEIGSAIEKKSRAIADKYRMPEELQGSVAEDLSLLAKPAWWAHGIGQMAGSMVGPAGVGGGAFKIGSGILKKVISDPKTVAKAAKYIGVGAGGAAGGTMEGSSTYNQVLEETGDEAKALRSGTLMAVGSAVLNSASFGSMLSPKTKSKLLHMVTAGITEGATEQAEEPWEAIVMNKPEEAAQRWLDGFNVFLPAMVTGGIGGLGGSVLTSDEKAEIRDAIKKTSDLKKRTDIPGLVLESDEDSLDADEHSFLKSWLDEEDYVDFIERRKYEAQHDPAAMAAIEEEELLHQQARQHDAGAMLKDRLATEEANDFLRQEQENFDTLRRGLSQAERALGDIFGQVKSEDDADYVRWWENLDLTPVSDIIENKQEILTKRPDITPAALNDLIIKKQAEKLETGQIEEPISPTAERPPVNEMQREADRLGVVYNGVQEGLREPLHLFTDKENGSTFAVKPGGSVEDALKANRERFAPKTPVGETGDATTQHKAEEATGGGKEQAAGVLGREKEPWEMTRDEYDAHRISIINPEIGFEVTDTEIQSVGKAGGVQGQMQTKNKKIVRRKNADSGVTTHEIRHLIDEKHGIHNAVVQFINAAKGRSQQLREWLYSRGYIHAGRSGHFDTKELTEAVINEYLSDPAGMEKIVPELKSLLDLTDLTNYKDFNISHRQQIKKALSEGKPVPPEVLKDYPDLQQKAEPTPEVTPKATPEAGLEKSPEAKESSPSGNKIKPGWAWIKEKQRPFTEWKEIVRGKNKGKIVVTVAGKKHIVEKGKVIRWTGKTEAGAEVAERANPAQKALFRRKDNNDVAFSLKTLDAWSQKAAKQAESRGIDPKAALKDLEKIRRIGEILNRKPELLREEGSGNPVRSNMDYIKTVDFNTNCPRRMEYAANVKTIEAELGRPMTSDELIGLSVMMLSEGKIAPCMYCYVEGTRRAFNDAILKYAQTNRGFNTEGFTQWWTERLEGRDISSQFSKKDLAAFEKARGYAQASSSANVAKGFDAYRGQLFNVSPETMDSINGRAGMRFNSNTDFQVDQIVDYMQAITDLAIMGSKAHAYTKEADFAKIFGATGMRINQSVFAKEVDGKVVEDAQQGMAWKDAKANAAANPKNVGTIMVVTSDSQLGWALDQPWIDMIIPFHRSGMTKEQYDSLGFADYTAKQSEKWIEPKKHAGEKPPHFKYDQHRNNKARYLKLCKDAGVHPRFREYVDHPNYMKLIADTVKAEIPQKPVKAQFDYEAAERVVRKWQKAGGYTKQNQADMAMVESMMARITGDARFRNTAPAKPQSGTPIATIQQTVSTLTRTWKNAPAIKVIQSTSELPDAIRKQISDNDVVAGAFHDDTVYLVADHTDNVMDAQQTILHETLAHWGLRKTFGKDLDPFLAKLYRAIDKDLLAPIAERYGFDLADRSDQLDCVEEYMASIAEMNKKPSVWDRMTRWIRRALTRMGFTFRPTKADVDGMIADALGKARRYVERGESPVVAGYQNGRPMFKAAAWHGSPHTFDKFSTEKIGTGEGAQAYGYGLYFAGAKEVAEFYRDTLSKGELLTVKRNGKIIAQGDTVSDDLLDAYKFIEMGRKQAQYPHLVAYIAKHAADRAASGLPGAQAKNERVKKLIDEYADAQFSYERPPSRLYEVELAPEEDEYLLWDKPLSEQSEKVRAALKKEIDNLVSPEEQTRFYRHNGQLYSEKTAPLRMKGESFYKFLSRRRGQEVHDKSSGAIRNEPDDKWASEYLHSLGIRGIKYLDGTSRGKGEGNFNYVIFSDQDVEIKGMFRKKDTDTAYEKAATSVISKLSSQSFRDSIYTSSPAVLARAAARYIAVRPAKVLKRDAPVAGSEAVRIQQAVETNSRKLKGKWESILDRASESLTREDKAWIRDKMFDAYQGGGKMPNPRIQAFADAWREISDSVINIARSLDVKEKVVVGDWAVYKNGDRPIRTFTDKEALKEWMDERTDQAELDVVYRPNAKEITRPISAIENYFPHILTYDAREALILQRGDLYDAIVEASHINGFDMKPLLNEVAIETKAKRNANLEHARQANIPTAVEVNGKQVNILESNPFELIQRHIEETSNRLSIIKQFGQEGAEKQFQEIYDKIRKESNSDTAEQWKWMWQEMNGTTRDMILHHMPRALAHFGSGAQAYASAAMLSLASVSNVISGPVPMAVRFGLGNTTKAWARVAANSIGKRLGVRMPETERLLEQFKEMGGWSRSTLRMTSDTEMIHEQAARYAETAMKWLGMDAANRHLNKVANLAAHYAMTDAIESLRNGTDNGGLKALWGMDAKGLKEMLKTEGGWDDADLERILKDGVTEDDAARFIQRSSTMTNVFMESAETKPQALGNGFWRRVFAYTSYFRMLGNTAMDTLSYAKKGNYRPLVILLLGAPAMALIDDSVRDFLKGTINQDERFGERLVEAVTGSGALGIPGTWYKSFKWWYRDGDAPFGMPVLEWYGKLANGFCKTAQKALSDDYDSDDAAFEAYRTAVKGSGILRVADNLMGGPYSEYLEDRYGGGYEDSRSRRYDRGSRGGR